MPKTWGDGPLAPTCHPRPRAGLRRRPNASCEPHGRGMWVQLFDEKEGAPVDSCPDP